MIAACPPLAELAERAGSVDLAQLDARLRASGGCARPIRLRGTVEVCDGHGKRRVWSTDSEPDGVLRKACGNRREAVCAPCAERYRQDAYHLIAAGLRGGKGVPDSINQHPAVFLTLTVHRKFQATRRFWPPIPRGWHGPCQICLKVSRAAEFRGLRATSNNTALGKPFHSAYDRGHV